jgi:hypothetical protein
MPADHFPRMRSRFFVCMKRILHIRFPLNIQPIHIEKTVHNTKTELGEYFNVVFSVDNIEKTDFEIVYDPNYKSEAIEMDQRRRGQFIQTDTSTNAYMEGRK